MAMFLNSRFNNDTNLLWTKTITTFNLTTYKIEIFKYPSYSMCLFLTKPIIEILI